MINRAVLFLAIVLSLTACSSSKKTAEDPDYPIATGIWQKQQVIVDGSDKEWDKSSLSFDLGSKVSYEITNDDTNLYVLITTIDRASQTKILRAGMSVYIDPAAKNRETEAVNFPLESGDAENMRVDPRTIAAQQGQPGDKPDLQQMRAKALISANQYILSGFSKGSGGYGINEQNAAGISLKINIDSTGEMVYEAAIPLRSLTQKALGRVGSPISVGIKINALPKPAMSSGGGGGYGGGGGGMRGGGGGMRGGGMGGGGMRGGGMGGGGMRGGGERGNGGNYAASQLLYKEVKFWKRTMIVQKA